MSKNRKSGLTYLSEAARSLLGKRELRNMIKQSLKIKSKPY